MYTPKPNSGSLFLNKWATEENKQPNYRGDFVLADGTLMEAVIWKSVTKDGEAYLRLKLGEPREKKPKESRPPPTTDEDIPY